MTKLINKIWKYLMYFIILNITFQDVMLKIFQKNYQKKWKKIFFLFKVQLVRLKNLVYPEIHRHLLLNNKNFINNQVINF